MRLNSKGTVGRFGGRKLICNKIITLANIVVFRNENMDSLKLKL